MATRGSWAIIPDVLINNLQDVWETGEGECNVSHVVPGR